jgi:dihydrofolate reductase
MNKVLASAVISVDGYIADENDQVGPLFDWLRNGSVATHFGNEHHPFHVSAASATYVQRVRDRVGACVIGRRLFDLTDGWSGVPSSGEHVYVVTHEPPGAWAYRDEAPFTFVTDGVGAAVAQAQGHHGDVYVYGGAMAGQALELGLLDEIHLNVAPVVMGNGRPFFGTYAGQRVLLGDPEIIIGERVVHMTYPVGRQEV